MATFIAKRLGSCGLLVLLPLLVGCASQWEQNFEPTENFQKDALAASQSVELRSVPIERIQRYEQTERQLQIESTTAPADWDARQRREAEGRLLAALQLPADEARPVVLGWSDFYTTDNPGMDELKSFARKIGANLVVVAQAPAGQVTSVRQEAVQSHRDGWVTPLGGRGRSRGRYSGGYFYSDRSTTWVPVAVTENQTYYQAFFLRRSAQYP